MIKLSQSTVKDTMRKLLTGFVILALTLGLAFTPKRVNADPPLRILPLCDSISLEVSGVGYPPELSRLLTAAGVSHTMLPGTVGGTGLDYWLTHITAVMNAQQPDVVLFNCGTNDSWWVGHDVTSWEAAYRTVVEAILNWRTPNRVKLGLSYIQYSTYPASQAMIDQQPATNDAINRNLGYYTSFTTGFADFRKLPPNGLYLNSSGYHPTTRGYNAMARIWFDAMQPGMGWTATTEPALCGLDGAPLLRGYARPTPIACTGQ